MDGLNWLAGSLSQLLRPVCNGDSQQLILSLQFDEASFGCLNERDHAVRRLMARRWSKWMEEEGRRDRKRLDLSPVKAASSPLTRQALIDRRWRRDQPKHSSHISYQDFYNSVTVPRSSPGQHTYRFEAQHSSLPSFSLQRSICYRLLRGENVNF